MTPSPDPSELLTLLAHVDAPTRTRALAAYAQQVRAQERAHLARELHDGLGGELTALKMALARLVQQLPPALPAPLATTHYADRLVERSIATLQDIARALRPAALEHGLVAALAWQAEQFALQTGYPCQFSAPAGPLRLCDQQEQALLRFAQEGLTNIAKHAHASRAQLSLTVDGAQLCLLLSDNGIGCTPAARGKSARHGLRGLRERADALGARMELADTPGGGTTLAIKISLGGPETPIIANADAT